MSTTTVTERRTTVRFVVPRSPSSTNVKGYRAPNTGMFKYMPSAVVPYAELMRLDRPSGYYAFYWHMAIGLAFAACVAEPTVSLSALAGLAIYLAAWMLFMRGASCAWNDNLDQKYDRLVERCKYRPIARGAVSTLQGHLFTLALIVVGGIMLAPLPSTVSVYSAIMLAILMIYPLGKRCTDFPQVVLGFGLGIPIFTALAAVGVDLPSLHNLPSRQDMTSVTKGAVCLYLASVFWTIIFDTVYAHQDIKDDIKAGVKSLAVRLGDKTKLGCGIMAATQVALLISAGIQCNLSVAYFAISCGGTALSLLSMLILVDLEKPAECAWWFGPGSRLVGFSVVGGLLCEYAMKLVA